MRLGSSHQISRQSECSESRSINAALEKHHEDTLATANPIQSVYLYRSAGQRAAYQINSARISIASRTSSSVLKKCGDMRRPTPGRQSTKTFRSARRLTIAEPSST